MPYLLLQLVVTLIVVGVILWAIEQFPAIDPTLKNVIRVLIIVFVVIWLLYALVGYVPITGPPYFRR